MVARRESAMRDESGQAVLEYVLVLFVSVTLILGLLYQFNSAFKAYASNLFGNYIACLIETGELPGSQACASSFVEFDINNGNTIVGPKTQFAAKGSGDSAGGKGAKGGAGGKGDGSDGSGGGGGGATNEAVAGGAGTSVASTGGGSSGRGPTGMLFSSKKHTTAVGSVGGDEEKSAYAGFGSSGGMAATSRPVGTLDRYQRKKSVALGYTSSGGEEKKEDEKNRPKAASAGKTEGSRALRPKKVAVDLNRAPAKAASSEDQEFSISGLIRILLIIAIIIIIIVFFGGQLMQISKAQEK
jgi:hypothetical protein